MSHSWFEMHDIDASLLKYVILFAEYGNQLILIRHRERAVWELPGGKIEAGESIHEAAGRELYEESGAIDFSLTPIGIYELNGTYGAVLHAKVDQLGPLPESEIAEVRLNEGLPIGLNYGDIYYDMYDRWLAFKARQVQYPSTKSNE
ncbi:NUDIX hydrolase [Paenibacillus kobensis]|uniref:NUDIX hydrolase n=1 Tax=Paenibacillus kobensis TaxID=59841 RepID=UPI0013E367DE|nr:NUDIX domain-containing protein [Paenibacillus kobensis]